MNCLIEFIDKHLSLIRQNSSDVALEPLEPNYPQFVLDHSDREYDTTCRCLYGCDGNHAIVFQSEDLYGDDDWEDYLFRT